MGQKKNRSTETINVKKVKIYNFNFELQNKMNALTFFFLMENLDKNIIRSKAIQKIWIYIISKKKKTWI